MIPYGLPWWLSSEEFCAIQEIQGNWATDLIWSDLSNTHAALDFQWVPERIPRGLAQSPSCSARSLLVLYGDNVARSSWHIIVFQASVLWMKLGKYFIKSIHVYGIPNAEKLLSRFWNLFYEGFAMWLQPQFPSLQSDNNNFTHLKGLHEGQVQWCLLSSSEVPGLKEEVSNVPTEMGLILCSVLGHRNKTQPTWALTWGSLLWKHLRHYAEHNEDI